MNETSENTINRFVIFIIFIKKKKFNSYKILDLVIVKYVTQMKQNIHVQNVRLKHVI